jgi:hypothetical protein
MSYDRILRRIFELESQARQGFPDPSKHWKTGSPAQGPMADLVFGRPQHPRCTGTNTDVAVRHYTNDLFRPSLHIGRTGGGYVPTPRRNALTALVTTVDWLVRFERDRVLTTPTRQLIAFVGVLAYWVGIFVGSAGSNAVSITLVIWGLLLLLLVHALAWVFRPTKPQPQLMSAVTLDRLVADPTKALFEVVQQAERVGVETAIGGPPPMPLGIDAKPRPDWPEIGLINPSPNATADDRSTCEIVGGHVLAHGRRSCACGEIRRR